MAASAEEAPVDTAPVAEERVAEAPRQHASPESRQCVYLMSVGLSPMRSLLHALHLPFASRGRFFPIGRHCGGQRRQTTPAWPQECVTALHKARRPQVRSVPFLKYSTEDFVKTSYRHRHQHCRWICRGALILNSGAGGSSSSELAGVCLAVRAHERVTSGGACCGAPLPLSVLLSVRAHAAKGLDGDVRPGCAGFFHDWRRRCSVVTPTHSLHVAQVIMSKNHILSLR